MEGISGSKGGERNSLVIESYVKSMGATVPLKRSVQMSVKAVVSEKGLSGSISAGHVVNDGATSGGVCEDCEAPEGVASDVLADVFCEGVCRMCG
jgi:hypothetical protein